MNELRTRVILRNDSSGNWETVKDTVILLKGEIGIEFIPNADVDAPKVKMKIGDGHHTWAQLSYFGGEEARVIEVTVAKDADHLTAINANLNGIIPNTHDVAIVQEAIIADDLISESVTQKYQHTAYRFNGTTWVAFDGNYNAKNVIFDEDFTFTKAVGTVTIPSSGSKVVSAAGKSIKDFFAGIFAAEDNPTRTANTSVTWTTEPKGDVEVGSEVTPTYNAKFSAGSYKYGPATGITPTWDVDIADLSDANKTTNSGSFSTFTATDGMSGYAKITAKATYEDGAIPVTNIGNKYDEDGSKNVRIMAGSKSATSAGYTSYRAWFHGYKSGTAKVDLSTIDSTFIRGLTSGKGVFTGTLATTDMQQMFFAAPAGVIDSVSVAHSVNGAPQTVKQTTVFVKGANNYVVDVEPEVDADNNKNGMKYDLFYVSNDNPNSGDASYTISVKLK